MTNRVVLRPFLLPKRLLAQWPAHQALSEAKFIRTFSNDNSDGIASERVSGSTEGRKNRLDQLERKFANTGTDTSRLIQSDAELQPEWKSMESRVTNRRTLTKEESGGKTGRSNIRQTEEDVWLESGLYHTDDNKSKDK